MDNENVYLKCIEQKKDTLKQRKAEYDEKLNELARQNSEYSEAVTILAQIGSALAISTISGDVKNTEKLKVEAIKYSAIKKEIEKRAGIEPFKYECSLCNDTGFSGGKICSCIKKMASEIRINAVSKSAPISGCRFDTFDLDFYDDSLPDGTNPKKKMTLILKALKEYTLNFNPNLSENMIFFGNTGLGKTHLSLAIMNELIEKGFYVVYDSAFNLFSKIETEHFKNHIDDTYNDALNCDLLIIDDLGSEFLSSYSQSVLYSIINTRILSRKPTIINTNLSIKEIEQKYTPRVSSRIVGEYTPKKFIGTDIRQKKVLRTK